MFVVDNIVEEFHARLHVATAHMDLRAPAECKDVVPHEDSAAVVYREPAVEHVVDQVVLDHEIGAAFVGIDAAGGHVVDVVVMDPRAR